MPAAVYKRDMEEFPIPTKRVSTPFNEPKSSTPEEIIVKSQPLVVQDDVPNEEPLIPISEREISELKKELKRIANRRAIEIASKLSADSEKQDTELKLSEKMLIKIDLELQRLNGVANNGTVSTKQTGFVNINNNNTSSMLIDGGKMYTSDYLRNQLNVLKENTKEEVFNVIKRMICLICLYPCPSR